MGYTANEKRYDKMPYRRCGESGLKLPAVSLGLWHNFGDNNDKDPDLIVKSGSFHIILHCAVF